MACTLRAAPFTSWRGFVTTNPIELEIILTNLTTIPKNTYEVNVSLLDPNDKLPGADYTFNYTADFSNGTSDYIFVRNNGTSLQGLFRVLQPGTWTIDVTFDSSADFTTGVREPHQHNECRDYFSVLEQRQADSNNAIQELIAEINASDYKLENLTKHLDTLATNTENSNKKIENLTVFLALLALISIFGSINFIVKMLWDNLGEAVFGGILLIYALLAFVFLILVPLKSQLLIFFEVAGAVLLVTLGGALLCGYTKKVKTEHPFLYYAILVVLTILNLLVTGIYVFKWFTEDYGILSALDALAYGFLGVLLFRVLLENLPRRKRPLVIFCSKLLKKLKEYLKLGEKKFKRIMIRS